MMTRGVLNREKIFTLRHLTTTLLSLVLHARLPPIWTRNQLLLECTNSQKIFGKGPMKSMPHTLKSSTVKIGYNGIIFFLVTQPNY